MNDLKVWLKREKDVSEVLRIVALRNKKIRVFVLLSAYDMGSPALGKILFDEQGYWIYDGDDLKVHEQEQVAAFIQKNFLGRENE